VRLGLTLEYIEQHASSKDVSLSQWLAKLTQPEIYHDSAVYRLQAERWRWHDSLVVLSALAVLVLSVS
ncbi:MAG: hypothetical protein ACYC4K_08305, partial [Thiobacillus sp.]